MGAGAARGPGGGRRERRPPHLQGAKTLHELGWRLPRPPRAPARADIMAARIEGPGAPEEWAAWVCAPRRERRAAVGSDADDAARAA